VLKVADMTLADVTSRRIEPLTLQNITDGRMLSGWCDLRQDFRTFRLDLLCDPRVTEHRFVEKPDRSLSVFLQKVRAESVMRPSAPA
jgi:predicted DNA-binding transcriptional regulator YafY